MPPKPKKKKATGPPMQFGAPMGLDPSQPIADEQGRYRSVAGSNPAPSMSVAPKPIPPVSATADTVARRMASRAEMDSGQPLSSMQPKKKAKKSLMQLFMEMNS